MTATIEWNVSVARWRDFLAQCPDATYFHGPEWHLAQAEARGWRLCPAILQFESGASAFLPLATRRVYKGLWVEARSGLESGYGGLTAPSPLTPAEVEAAYALVRSRFPDLIVTGSPHEAFCNVPGGVVVDEDRTQAVAIAPRPEMESAMTKKRRESVRRAGKDGFELEVVEAPTEADVERFMSLYAEHAAGWTYRKWVQDETYFRQMLRHGNGHIVLMLAHHEGRLAAFRLLGLQGRLAMAIHLARAEAYAKSGVGPWFQGVTLDWCHARGLSHLDLMPSGQLESVREYKASFGAIALPFTTVAHRSLIGQGLQHLRAVAVKGEAVAS